MPLFIPVLIGAGVIALTGLGAKKGSEGVSAMQRAKAIGADAEHRHAHHVGLVENARNALAGQLGALQEERIACARTTLGRMVELLQALERRGKVRSVAAFARLGVEPEVVRQFVAQYLEVGGTLQGTLAAAGAGAGASAATTGLVSAFATASTGAAISGLSGAAAESALLAWLGGGSLAAGGGGMALGSVMLGGIAIAPAVAVGGFVLAAQGEKALTRALEYEADVSVAIERMNALIAFHGEAERRVLELRSVTESVRVRTERAINNTSAIADVFDADNDSHVASLSIAMLLAKALSELIQARVLDDDGMLDAASTEAIARHSCLVEGV